MHGMDILGAGLGFHLEATLEEAPRIIGIRKASVEKKIEAALDQVGGLGGLHGYVGRVNQL